MWLLLFVDVQLCSIGSVYLNKHLLDSTEDGWVTLTAMQLLMKWLVLEIVVRTGYFKLIPKEVEVLQKIHSTGTVRDVIWYASMHVTGLLSLKNNSLLFDQTVKMGMVPATVLFHSLFRGNPIPPFSWPANAATVSGCALYYTADTSATAFGGFIALLYFALRSMYDVNKDDSTEGELHRMEPISAALLLTLAVFMEPNWYDLLTSPEILLIASLGSVANLFAQIGMVAVVERANVAAISVFFCVQKLFLFVLIECIVIGRTTIVAEQTMGMLLVMVGLMAAFNPLSAHCMLIIGTIYITVIANRSFLTPFHFT